MPKKKTDNKTVKLYDLPKGTKIYEELSDGSTYFIFDHIDGMYSYNKTEKGGIIHIKAFAELVKHEDGYKLVE